jgi:PilZ domain
MQMIETRSEDPGDDAEQERRPVVLARVTCDFPDGEKRVLFLTQLSLGGAFILAMRMPALATKFMLRIFPHAMQPLRPIEVQVISQRLDPREPERCGFGVVFVELDDLQIEELSSVTTELAGQHRMLPRVSDRLRPERRCSPRINTNLAGMVSIGDHVLPGRVLNLSLNGAFVLLADTPMPPALTRGAEITLDLLHHKAPDSLSIRATVVRRGGGEAHAGVGIRFHDLDEQELKRVEGLILASMIEGDSLLDG